MSSNSSYPIPEIKLASVTVFFNDCKSLKRTLDALTVGVDLMICIDGKFKQYQSQNQFSDDGSRELVLSYPNAILDDCANKDEWEKRQRGLDLCGIHRCNFMLICDSDEYPEPYPKTDWKKFRENLRKIVFLRDKGLYNVYGIKKRTWNGSADQYGDYPDLWYAPYNMEYHSKRHFLFRNKDVKRWNTPLEGSYQIDIIPGLHLEHNHLLRSGQHMEGRFVYQKWLTQWEGRDDY